MERPNPAKAVNQLLADLEDPHSPIADALCTASMLCLGFDSEPSTMELKANAIANMLDKADTAWQGHMAKIRAQLKAV